MLNNHMVVFNCDSNRLVNRDVVLLRFKDIGVFSSPNAPKTKWEEELPINTSIKRHFLELMPSFLSVLHCEG